MKIRTAGFFACPILALFLACSGGGSNGDGGSGAPALVITGVSPNPYMPGRSRFTISGSGFAAGARVRISGSSYEGNEVVLSAPEVEVVSSTQIRLNLLAPGGSTIWHGLNGAGAGFAVENPGGGTSASSFVPARPMTLHMIFQTHLDIGYNGAPSEVAQRYKIFYDRVLQMVEQDTWLEENGRTRFLVETLWQLEQFIARSSPDEIARFMDQVRRGRIEVGAGYCTPQTAALGYEELSRLFEPAAEFRRTYGIPIETVVFNDQPGCAWGVVDAAVASGVRYFMSGINLWNGDAIPGNPFPPASAPFWWASRSGNRLLFWPSIGEQNRGGRPWDAHAYTVLNDGAYGIALKSFGLAILPAQYIPPGQAQEWDEAHLEGRVLRGLGFYADRDYPHGDLLLPAANSDNNWGGPLAGIIPDWPFCKYSWMTAAARSVNASQRGLTVRIGTPTPFFRKLEQSQANFPQIPPAGAEYGGDWPSIWENGDAGAFRSMQRVRSARELAAAGEKLVVLGKQLTGSNSHPSGEFAPVWENLRCWGEHTCPNGTVNGESPGTLTYEEVLAHDTEHVQYAVQADASAHGLADAGLAGLAAPLADPVETRIAVFNPTSFVRTDLVSIHAAESGPFDLIDAQSGVALPYQLSSSEAGRILFNAPDVPANGYRVFDLRPVATAPQFPSGVTVDAAGRRIENAFYRITLGEDGFPVEIFDKALGRDLIDHAAPYRFLRLSGIAREDMVRNGFGFASVPHQEPTQPLGEIRAAENGPSVGSLRVKRPGSPQVETEIRLLAGIPHAEFRVTLDTEALQPIEGKNTGWFMPFPLALNHSFALKTDTSSGYLDAFRDHLPGSYDDLMHVVHGLWAGDERTSIELGADGALVWGLPTPAGFVGMVGGRTEGRSRPPFATLLNWIYENTRPGLVTFKSGPPVPGDQDPNTPGYQALSIREPGLSGPIVLSYFLRSRPGGAFHASSAAPFLGRINNPLLAIRIEAAAPSILQPPTTASLVRADQPNAEITGIRPTRNGNGIVVRLRELDGTAGKVRIASDLFSILSAHRVNLVEEEDAGLPSMTVADGVASFHLRAYETAAIIIDTVIRK